MLQLKKTIIICITVVVCVWIVVHRSPYRVYVDDCVEEHPYYSLEFCSWMYFEMRKEESWLRRILLELGH